MKCPNAILMLLVRPNHASTTILKISFLSVGRDCELVKPDQTIVRVTLAGTDQFQVQYTAPETETASIIHVIKLLFRE